MRLTSDGSIVTWGYDGHSEISGAPTGTGFKQVAAGDNMAYALTADGSIDAWGDNTYDQVSGAPTGTGYIAISAGYYSGYALKADGSIVAWGRDQYGEVSDTPTGTGFTAIAGGDFFAYALTANGSIDAWGNDYYYDPVSGTPTGTGFTSIAAGNFNGFALTSDGAVDAWKYDYYGVVSDARREQASRPSLRDTTAGTHWAPTAPSPLGVMTVTEPSPTRPPDPGTSPSPPAVLPAMHWRPSPSRRILPYWRVGAWMLTKRTARRDPMTLM